MLREKVLTPWNLDAERVEEELEGWHTIRDRDGSAGGDLPSRQGASPIHIAGMARMGEEECLGRH